MQSKLLGQIMHHFPLSFQEQGVLKRGRNAASGRKTYPKRLTTSSSYVVTGFKNQNATTASTINVEQAGGVSIYQDATAFEALLGYLYMTNSSRCNEFLEFVDHELHQREL